MTNNKINFYVADKVFAEPYQCTAQKFKELMERPSTAYGIKRFQETGNRDDKSNYLPVARFHANFPNGGMSDDDAQPSGLIAIDVDDHNSLFGIDPDAQFEQYIKPYLSGRLAHVLMVYKTPSGVGLRVVAKRRTSLSIFEEQRILFNETCGNLPIGCFDKECCNISRSFFLPTPDYLYYINYGELFGGDMDETFAKSLNSSNAMTSWNIAKASADNAEVLADENDLAIEDAAGPDMPHEESLVSADVLAKISDDGLFYGDISYETLRSELCRAFKCTGRKGTRNNDTYKIACQLAHISRGIDHLCSVLPQWGLDNKEMKEIAQNAFKAIEPGEPISQPLSGIIDRFQSEDVVESAPALPQRLPKAFRVLLAPFPESKKKAMAISCLPSLGALATNARFKYFEDEIHSLSFITHLVAPPASGKSNMVKLSNLLLEDIQKADDEAREKIDQFKDQKEEAGQGKGPKNDHPMVRNFTPKTTYASMMEYMKAAKGKHLIVIAPEATTINQFEWWDHGTTALLAFDNEKGGRETKSSNSTTAHLPFYCNMALSGTPEKSIQMYKSVGDGLVTRVAFCTFENERGGIHESNNPRNAANLRAVKAIIDKLDNEPMPEKPYELRKIEAAIHKWCDEKGQLFTLTGDDSIETFRIRAAVIGFRAGALAWLLEGKRETTEAIDFALWVAEYTLFYQRKLFGEKANIDMEANRKALSGMRVNETSNLFESLGNNFETADLVKIYQSRGQAGTGSRGTIKRWINNGWVERLSNGKFCKTSTGIQVSERLSLIAS